MVELLRPALRGVALVLLFALLSASVLLASMWCAEHLCLSDLAAPRNALLYRAPACTYDHALVSEWIKKPWSRGGTVPVHWEVPASAGASPDRVVVYTHDLDEDLGTAAHAARALAEASGAPVVCWDPCGFGLHADEVASRTPAGMLACLALVERHARTVVPAPARFFMVAKGMGCAIAAAHVAGKARLGSEGVLVAIDPRLDEFRWMVRSEGAARRLASWASPVWDAERVMRTQPWPLAIVSTGAGGQQYEAELAEVERSRTVAGLATERTPRTPGAGWAERAAAIVARRDGTEDASRTPRPPTQHAQHMQPTLNQQGLPVQTSQPEIPGHASQPAHSTRATPARTPGASRLATLVEGDESESDGSSDEDGDGDGDGAGAGYGDSDGAGGDAGDAGDRGADRGDEVDFEREPVHFTGDGESDDTDDSDY